MRIFVSDFLTSPFLNVNLKEDLLAYFLYEGILNKSNFEEEEVDLVYFFGLKRNKAKEYFSFPNNSILFLESNSSLISNFVSACHLLKSNKANVIFLISICSQPEENPFLSQKDFLLNRAKENGINKPLMDEIFLKSYFKYEYFYSKDLFKEEFQPVICWEKEKEIFLKDHFFYNGTTRENLNLAKMKTSLPWEIFSDYHFSPGASGGCAVVLVNEEMAREKNLKNIVEISFFNFLISKRDPFPLNLVEAFSQNRDLSYKAAFVSTPCIIYEAFARSFFSNGTLQKEYLGSTINLEEINPYGCDLFSGWIEGTSFLRRVGFLKNFILGKKGKGILIENNPLGPEFYMEITGE